MKKKEMVIYGYEDLYDEINELENKDHLTNDQYDRLRSLYFQYNDLHVSYGFPIPDDRLERMEEMMYDDEPEIEFPL